MTRTDAIDWINRLIVTMKEETSGDFPEPKYKDEVYEALEMAIKALEQESVLDKIRAEIQGLRSCSCYNSEDGIIDDVEDIIDKYRAESGVEE